MDRLPRVVAGALATAALCVTAGASMADDPGFQPPLDLAPDYLYAGPQIAPDPDGSVAAWQERGPENNLLEVHSAHIPALGLSTTQDLHALTFFGTDIAASGTGPAVVAWDEHSQACCTTLSVSLRPSTGAPFSAPVSVPAGTGFVGRVAVAMNHNGDALVAYILHGADNHERIWAVFRPAGGSFGAPLPVSDEAVNASFQYLDAALADNGDAVVAWDPAPSNYPTVVHAALGTASGFGAPIALSDPAVYSARAAVASDPAGDAVVVWQTIPQDGGPSTVYAAFRASGSTTFTTQPLGPGNASAWAQVGLSDDGRGLVSYVTPDFTVRVVPVDAPTKTIGAGHDLAGPTGWARSSVNGAGRALVAWESPVDVSRSPPYAAATWVAWGDVSGTFGPVANLTCPQPWRSLGSVVVDPDGSAAIHVQNRGADVPDDADDRAEILRSSTAIPADVTGCRDWAEPSPPPSGGGSPAPGQTPVGPPAQAAAPPPPQATLPPPRISLTQRSVALDARKRITVVVSTTAAGRLRLDGTLRVARRHIRAFQLARRVASGITELAGKVRRAAARAVSRSHTARIAVTARLTSDDGRIARARVQLRLRARR